MEEKQQDALVIVPPRYSDRAMWIKMAAVLVALSAAWLAIIVVFVFAFDASRDVIMAVGTPITIFSIGTITYAWSGYRRARRRRERRC